MNEARIAEALLALLASGATLERTVSDLPAFKSQIDAAVEWMKSNARCPVAEMGQVPDRLRALIRRKDDAVRHQEWDLAAAVRAEECALFESLGLRAPTGETWHMVLYTGIDEQTRHLSALLSELQKCKCEPGAAPPSVS